MSDPITRFVAPENAWMGLGLIVAGCGVVAYFTTPAELGVAGTAIAIAAIFAVAMVIVDLWRSFVSPSSEKRSDLQSGTRSEGVSRKRASQIGVAMLIAIGGGGFLTWQIQHGRVGQLYATDIGQIRTISLPDGTRVTLNTNSLLRVRYQEGLRLVVLEGGEALFSVVPRKAEPFEVISGGTTVRAVGTEFSVRARDEGATEVLVAEGTVQVQSEAGEGKVASAGDRVDAREREITVRRLDSAELSCKLAWKTGHLIFVDEPLAAVVREFNRYHRRKVVVADPVVGQISLNGEVSVTQEPALFAQALRRLDVEVTRGRAGEYELRAAGANGRPAGSYERGRPTEAGKAVDESL